MCIIYVYNLQGDVRAIVDSNLDKVVEYMYDPWGQVLSVTGDMADTLGQDNPFRYRGYYFDNETGLYYVNARYFDPVTDRWLNADNQIDEGAGLASTNLYAYCANDPVNNVDPTGKFVLTVTAIIAIVSVVVGVVAAGYTAYDSHKQTGQIDWGASILNGIGWGLTAYTLGMSAYGVYCNYSYSTGKTPVTSVTIGNTPAPAPSGVTTTVKPPTAAKTTTAPQTVTAQNPTVQQFDANQNALIDLIKENGKSNPIPMFNAKTLVMWGNEYGIDVHIHMGHLNRASLISQNPHLHTGFNNWHIPIFPD